MVAEAHTYDPSVRPVVIVQHEASVPPGLIDPVLSRCGVHVEILHAWRNDAWPSVDDVAAVVVMGGTMNVDQLEDYPFLEKSRALMGDAIEAGVPTLGVCLGSQMMARVLGAEVRRADHRNALFSRLELTAEGARDPLTRPFADVEVLQFHEDTFAVPEGAVPLATSADNGLAQAFRYGDSAYAIQFHFEVDRTILRGWLDNIGPTAMLEEWRCAAEELVETGDRLLPSQRRAGHELVERFAELVITNEGG